MRAGQLPALRAVAAPGFDTWHGTAAQILAEPGLLPAGFAMPTDRRPVVVVHAGLSVLVRRAGRASAGLYRVERVRLAPVRRPLHGHPAAPDIGRELRAADAGFQRLLALVAAP